LGQSRGATWLIHRCGLFMYIGKYSNTNVLNYWWRVPGKL
jgi:hypothetical protein